LNPFEVQCILYKNKCKVESIGELENGDWFLNKYWC